jgi:hypothetical protein
VRALVDQAAEVRIAERAARQDFSPRAGRRFERMAEQVPGRVGRVGITREASGGA